MERHEPLKAKTALRAKTPLRRKTPMRSRSGLRRVMGDAGPKKRKAGTPVRRCDDLARAINKALHPVCQRCGNPEKGVQWCHIMPRTYGFTRHDEDNALGLCFGCHAFFTSRPVEFINYVGEERWLDLKRRAEAGIGQKVNYVVREARLRQRARELDLAA